MRTWAIRLSGFSQKLVLVLVGVVLPRSGSSRRWCIKMGTWSWSEWMKSYLLPVWKLNDPLKLHKPIDIVG